MLILCDVHSEYEPKDHPLSYRPRNICGHVLLMKKEETETYTNYLTMLDLNKHKDKYRKLLSSPLFTKLAI